MVTCLRRIAQKWCLGLEWYGVICDCLLRHSTPHCSYKNKHLILFARVLSKYIHICDESGRGGPRQRSVCLTFQWFLVGCPVTFPNSSFHSSVTTRVTFPNCEKYADISSAGLTGRDCDRSNMWPDALLSTLLLVLLGGVRGRRDLDCGISVGRKTAGT